MIKEVRQAFQDDQDILKYFDPTVPVTNTDEVCDNICDKLFEYALDYQANFVPINGGYIFTAGDHVLVSFGINVNMRTKKNLELLWGAINENLKRPFSCHLWAKNTRAINWLKRCGMTEGKTYEFEGHKIIELCH